VLFRFDLLPAEAREDIIARSNGHERCGIGIYGPRTNKFVTITGWVIRTTRLEIGVWQHPGMTDAYWKRQAKYATPENFIHFPSLYPPGPVGAEMALEDIRTGASLHPATLAFAAKASNWLSLPEVREALVTAYHASVIKGQARWEKRFASSIDGVLKWVEEQNGGELNPHRLITDSQRAKAKRQVQRLKRQGMVAQVAAAAPLERGQDGPDVAPHPDVATLFGGAPPAGEAAALNRLRDADPGDLVWYARAWREEQGLETPAEAVELEEALLDAAQIAETRAIVGESRRTLRPAAKGWMVDELPVEWLRTEALRMMGQQAATEEVLPGGAALTAIAGAMMAAAPGWVVERQGGGLTTIELIGACAAVTGSGKGVLMETAELYAREVGVVTGMTSSWRPLARLMHEQGERRAEQRCVCMVMDEVWAFFAALAGRDRPDFKRMVRSIMGQFGRGTGFIEGMPMANAALSVPEIANPCLVVLGYSTPSSLYQFMGPELFSNGLLGRMTIVIDDPVTDWRPDPDGLVPAETVPTPHTIRMLRLISQGGYVVSDHGRGELFHMDPLTHKRRRWVRFPEALRGVPMAMQKRLSGRYEIDTPEWSFCRRAAQKAIMLAGALAVAEAAEAAARPRDFDDRPAVITAGMLDYACRLIEATTEEFVRAYAISQTGETRAEQARTELERVMMAALDQPHLLKERYRVPYEHGLVGISYLYFRLRKWSRREVDDTLATLEHGHVLGPEEQWRKPSAHGRKGPVRRLLRSPFV
jgi:hypothetical protein